MSHLASLRKGEAWTAPLCSVPEGDALVYGFPAPQLAAAQPEKPMIRAVASLSHYPPEPGPQGRIDHPLDPGGWTRGRPPPTAPAVASTCLLPTRVRHRELLRAP